MSTLWPAEARLHTLDWGPLSAIRSQVVEALGPLLAGAEAARVLTHLLRRHPTWTAAERATAAEALFGVALWRRRLGSRTTAASAESLLDALVAEGRAEPAQWQVPPTDWPTRLSYPDWLVAELSRDLGTEAEAFAVASNLPGPITVRANTLRLTRDALRETLAEEGVGSAVTRWAVDGVTLSGRPNILGLKSHQTGLFEVQDEGSQLVGQCLGVQPGDVVLDLCAGSGGKTLLHGAALGDRGTLYAHDVDHPALERLAHRAARAGLHRSLRVLRSLPAGLRASRVLVDAPCSALGTLRRGPDVRWRLEPASLGAFQALQRQLLDVGGSHTAPAGRLVYATCTIRPEENQDVVEAFLDAHSDFVRAPLGLPQELLSPQGDLVTLPHRHGMDGFYAAALQRRSV